MVKRRTIAVRFAAGVACVCSALVLSLAAQSSAQVGIQFFQQGGVYCFRLAPEGTSLADESTWTLMMLTGTAYTKQTCRIRSFDAGATRSTGKDLKTIGLSVVEVWRRDSLRDEFFARFATGITNKVLRARVMTMTPPGWEGMNTEERAETYLKFADKGTRLDFSKVPDLGAAEFLAYQTYMPD